MHDHVSAMLEQQGFEFAWFEHAEDIVRSATPSLVVLCIEGALSGRAARDVESLAEMIGGAPIMVICEGIRPGELRRAGCGCGWSGLG